MKLRRLCVRVMVYEQLLCPVLTSGRGRSIPNSPYHDRVFAAAAHLSSRCGAEAKSWMGSR